MIAINQDSLGIQGLRYNVKDSLETWVKPLKNGDWALCFLNRGASAKTIDFDWTKEVINDTVAKRELNASATLYKLRNLWTKSDAGNTKKPLKAVIPSHEVMMFRLIK